MFEAQSQQDQVVGLHRQCQKESAAQVVILQKVAAAVAGKAATPEQWNRLKRLAQYQFEREQTV